jgi:hypothetical protein
MTRHHPHHDSREHEWPPSRTAAAIFCATESGGSCSQKRRTVQPSSLSAALTSESRAWLRAILGPQ